MRTVILSIIIYLLIGCTSNPPKTKTEHSKKYTTATPSEISDQILKEQLVINKRLLATIKAEQRLGSARVGSSGWVLRQLNGNPYSRGRRQLMEQQESLASVQRNLQQMISENNRMATLAYGSKYYKSNCFDVKPYYRKDGTFVKGHIRCK